MKIAKEQAEDIVNGCHDDWDMIEENVVDSGRWDIEYEGIFLHNPTGKFYETSWSRGATETQEDQDMFYDDEVDFVEVHQVEKLVKVWESVECLTQT